MTTKSPAAGAVLPDRAISGSPLDELRRRLLSATLHEAVFDGFTRATLKAGANAAGEPSTIVAAAWPNGVDDVIAFWSSEADAAAAAELERVATNEMRIRDRVALGVWTRIEYLAPHKEAARRAAAALAFPYRHPLAARLVWRSADAIWRALGDKSTDFNFYSKRAILSGVVATTQARWLADDEADAADTREFLRKRIDDVMQFEKLKAKVKAPPVGELVAALAKLRYPR